jgi:hypothetical protein
MTYPRLSMEEHQELERLRRDYPAWVFNSVRGRWIAEKHLGDGLIIIEKQNPAALRARVEHYEAPEPARREAMKGIDQ